MEISSSHVRAARMAACKLTQAAVEGDIPFPEGRGATDILLYMGDVTLNRSEVLPGAVTAEGRVKVQLICTDAQGTYGFTSSAPFRHTLQVPEAEAAMSARVSAALQTLEVKLTGGGPGADRMIALCAVIDIAARLTDDSPLEAVCGISGAEDLELREECLRTVSAAYEECSVHTRDEVGAGDIVEVLCCDAAAELGERAGCGTLRVSALVKRASGALSEECYTLPFDHELPDAVGARVDSVYIRCMSEEFSVLVIEAQLTLTAVRAQEGEAALPVDIYSPTLPLMPLCERQSFISYAGRIEKRETLTENVALTPGMPAIHHAAYASCRVGVTDSGTEEGRLYIEGLLFTKLVYHTDAGAYFSLSEDVPFSLELEAPAADIADVDVSCIACVKGCTADRIRVEYTLYVSAELYSLCTLNVVTGAQECEAAPKRHGIIVYFASEGETLFDVGRQFQISTARLKAANPQAGERLAAGERLTLIV